MNHEYDYIRYLQDSFIFGSWNDLHMNGPDQNSLRKYCGITKFRVFLLRQRTEYHLLQIE